MKQLTEAQLAALLTNAYNIGWNAAGRTVPDGDSVTLMSFEAEHHMPGFIETRQCAIDLLVGSV